VPILAVKSSSNAYLSALYHADCKKVFLSKALNTPHLVLSSKIPLVKPYALARGFSKFPTNSVPWEVQTSFPD
jgi:hypothetical protein